MISKFSRFFVYILVSFFAINASYASSIDVNTASIEALDSIKGIGPKMAKSIIEARNSGGPFESYSDLADRVKGLGEKKIKSLRKAGLFIKNAKDENAKTLPKSKIKIKKKSKSKKEKVKETAVPFDTFPKLVRPPKS